MRFTFHSTMAIAAYIMSENQVQALTLSNEDLGLKDENDLTWFSQLDSTDLTASEAHWLAQLEAEGAFDASDEELALAEVGSSSSGSSDTSSSSDSSGSSSSSSDSDSSDNKSQVASEEIDG